MQKDVLSSPQFFLGANTPLGFFSRFDHLYSPAEGWFCYILKGGPGTGKSTLMKNIAAEAKKKKIKIEMIHCASDPSSLDAVIFPEIKKCIVDGTAPHVIDPTYPGVADTIIHLGEFWNEKGLSKQGHDIINLTKENSDCHKKAQKFLAAYGSINNSTDKIISESIDYEKLDAYISRFTKKLVKNKSATGKKHETIRFISSATPDGYVFFDDTMEEISNRNFVIEDEHGIIGNLILQDLKTVAQSKNYDIISCFSPFFPKDKLEALFIPELSLGFLVVTPTQRLNLKNDYKKITVKKFLDKSKLSSNKYLLAFNKKINNKFLEEAVLNLNHTKSIHDKLESIYSKNMNYKKVNKITDKLISAILQ